MAFFEQNRTAEEMVAVLENSERLPITTEVLRAHWRNSALNPLDLEGITKDIINRRSFAPDQLKEEVKALPMHLQETVAFFTSIWYNEGVMNDHCKRPEGLPMEIAAYPECTCRRCLDEYHRRWAEAEENHWNIMNRFIASFNYMYDWEEVCRSLYAGNTNKVDLGTIPIIPNPVRFYAMKQNMLLETLAREIKETTERVLIIVHENNNGQNKVIACSNRATNPYPSSYFYFSGNSIVDLNPFYARPVEAACFRKRFTGAVKWTIIHVVLPLSVVHLARRAFQSS